METFEAIKLVVFLALLIDSVFANILEWSGHDRWYTRHFRFISKNFPLTKGWAAYYLILVLWMGVLMYT